MITARNYRNLVAGANQSLYAELERRIDNAINLALMLRKAEGEAITVNVDGVAESVRERAISEYTTEGWIVRVTSDCSQGDFIELRSR